MSEYSSLVEIAGAAVVLLLILLLTAFWRYMILRSHNISMLDLVPQDIGFVFGFGGLILFYMLDSFAYHMTRIPIWYPGQVAVWVIYLFLFLVLAGSVIYARLRQPDYEEIEEPEAIDRTDILLGNYTPATPSHYWRTLIIFVIVFEVSAVAFYFWQSFSYVVIVIAYITGVAAGFCLLVGALIEAAQGLILLKKKKIL